jgi:hypothetical protein
MTTEGTELLSNPSDFDKYCSRVEEQLRAQLRKREDAMRADSAGILDNREQFDRFCEQVAVQLRPQWEERIGLLQHATERLKALRGVAEAVRNDDLAQDLGRQLAEASADLQKLQAVSVHVRTEVSGAAS